MPAATDAGQTSHSALMDAGELRAGQRVGIIGLGGLGMTAARIAVIHGAEVYAAEPRKEAWRAAKDRGVVEIVEDVRGLAPFELDLIVDFAGFGDTTAGAISVVRRGGLVVQVGLGRTQATISTMDLISRPSPRCVARAEAGRRTPPLCSDIWRTANSPSKPPQSDSARDSPRVWSALGQGAVSSGRIVAELNAMTDI